ncbi:archease [Candidatus Woesearchaeota archaeon]|nr:archease [Candidatus Woesearchaeota archaeon]
MQPSYQFIDHTADILFQAEGNTPSELFEQCALALENSQVDLSKIEPVIKKEWKATNHRIDSMLFDFLDDLLFFKDTEQLLFCKFQIDVQEKEGEFFMTVSAWGENLNIEKHQPKVDVKAITMHMFEVKKTDIGWWAKVLIDI